MPKNPFDNTVLGVDPEDLQANENSQVGLQANETFVLNAGDGATLGSGGELTGFAKKAMGSDAELIQEILQEGQAQVAKLHELNSRIQNGGEASPNIRGPERYKALNQTRLEALGEITPANAAEHARLTNENQGYDEEIAGYVADAAAAAAELAEYRQGRENGVEVPGLKDKVAAVELAQEKQSAYVKLVNTTGSLYEDSFEFQADPELGGDRNMLTRAVASTAVDRLIGTNVLAEEKFGVDTNGQVVGISIQADGAGVKSDFRGADGVKKECFLQADYANANIQKGLSDLEVVDYITGQVDRHAGNIFVEPTSGKVTGIDNDMAFPEAARTTMSPGGEFKGTEHLPRKMDRQTADKIAAMDPEALRATLEGVKKPGTDVALSAKEINGAVQRLQELQAAIADPASVPRPDWESNSANLSEAEKAELAAVPPFQIVDKFTPATYAESVRHQDLRVKAASGTALSQAENPAEAAAFNRTSYVGSIEGQRKNNELNQARQPEAFGVRPANTALPAPKDIGLATCNKVAAERFDTLVNQTREGLKADPSQIGHSAQSQQVRALNAEIAALEKKIGEYEKREQKPTLGDRFRGLRGSGIQAELDAKKVAALDSLKDKKAELDKALDKAMEPMIPDLVQAAQHEGNLARAAMEAQATPKVTESVKETLKRTQAASVASHHDVNVEGPRQPRARAGGLSSAG